MPRLKKVLALSAAISALLCWGAFELNFIRRPPVAHIDHNQITRYASGDILYCAKARTYSLINKTAASQWARCEQHLESYGALEEFKTDYRLIGGLGSLAFLSFLAMAGIALTEAPPIKIKRGPKPLEGSAARADMKRVSRIECQRSGKGIEFPPGISMSRDRESRHIMITGGVGSGKTQTMRHLMMEALKRGDKMLVLDTKGDMTEGLPGDIVLLAPQDARSAAWDVATDCQSKQDARELAARFIPKSDDPMWAEAARELLVTCLVSLQQEKPGSWTWADLYSRTIMEPEVLHGYARKYHPSACQLLTDPTSKTTMSILTTFKTYLPTIEALAEAWGDKGDKAFSISRWLHETEGTVPIVLQRDGRYPQLSNAWISGIIGILASHVGSPSLEESDERRIWLFLDEFPQLERMEDFSALLDLGRSKGICIVLSAQDTSQIRIRYGKDRTSSWFSMVGTHIVCRLNVGEGAEDISRAIGMQEIEVPVRSKGYSGGRFTSSTSMQARQRFAITASEISGKLGPRKHGVRVMFIGLGENLHIVDVPYLPFDKERKAHVPAIWTQVGSCLSKLETADDLQLVEPGIGLLSDEDLARIRQKKKRDPD